ncbi:NAC transcription factor 25-like [Pyrus ussuriensis x Pyrus communis]|uniref:NAC transcription factor 25-like n=1 Tax=Pyrus ussuriensis x Pyrus communis TaxID=2448454 RepID=A0A5N5I3Y8_9ROSA|nr:NAC transcription factor 25-like [Pyrus ussuriensis x Pyrus communis]
MDKFKFVGNGMIRLPPGFRFQPTDEELVFQYLRCKVFSCPLPASIIPEINVCMYDPWDLPGNLEQERYFFSNKESKYRNGNRANRVTGSGYWKATGADKKIVSSRRNHIVGKKKTLVFYRGKSPHVSKTDWVMHEYCLVNTETTASIHTTENALTPKGNWVLCRVFSKKRSGKIDEEIVVNYNSIEVNNNANPASSSSSCSSSTGITEVTSPSKECGEEISSCPKF